MAFDMQIQVTSSYRDSFFLIVILFILLFGLLVATLYKY